LNQLGNVSVYLDATHSNWLGVDKISTRLIPLVSLGRPVSSGRLELPVHDQLVQYGTWISKCIANGVSDLREHLLERRPAHLGRWSMSPFGQWSDRRPILR